MTALQRLTLRASEIRQRLNEITGLEGEAFTEEIRQESDRLTVEFREVETKLRAATVAGDGDPPEDPSAGSGDPETRKRAALVQRCGVGEIFAAAFEHRSTEGAEAELQSELGLNPNQVPLELLRRAPEIRTTVTTAPANVGASEQPVVMPVFARGDAAYLGVEMPSVPSGDAVFPVLGTRPTVGGPHADSTSVDATNATFTAEALVPNRLQASFFYRRTDAARFRGMSGSLRDALSEGLSEALDKEVIDQIVTDVTRTDASAVDTDATYRNRLLYSQIDGRFAQQESDLRMLVGSDTLADMAALFRGNNTEQSSVEVMRRLSGGIRVSPHIPATSGNKQDVILRKGMRRDAVAPMWEGITLIPDEVTKAATGEIVITAVLLAAFKVIRTAGFARVQAQHQ